MSASATLVPLAGFANEGGPLGATLATIDAVFPLACDAGGERLTIAPVDSMSVETPPLLPQPARGSSEGEFGAEEGRRDVREARHSERPDALRYYDVARDFQPGVQRTAGRAAIGRGRTIEFPGALHAKDARALAEAAVRRSGWRCERQNWRTAELDASLTPGSEVRVPGQPGNWVVESWEWRTDGVELELVRRKPGISSPAVGDPGHAPAPADELSGASILAAFETPPPGLEVESPTLFAAGTCESGTWSGAALYVDRAGELVPVGRLGRTRATIGMLLLPLAGSPGLLFEPQATLDVELRGDGGDGFSPATVAGLAQGANRLLVGGEVVQFAGAERTGQTTWRLSGLLRGRGGTEPAAQAGHPAGTFVLLLDDAPLALDTALVARDAATTLAAVGFGDADPVYASLANAGLGQKPPTPVHPRITDDQDGDRTFRWTRRARGAWLWVDGVDAPLVEQDESYRVGLGPVDAPIAVWITKVPELVLEGGSINSLAANHPGFAMWVRQIGSHAQSDPLFLMRFP